LISFAVVLPHRYRIAQLQHKGAKPQRFLGSNSRKSIETPFGFVFFETGFVFLGVLASSR